VAIAWVAQTLRSMRSEGCDTALGSATNGSAPGLVDGPRGLDVQAFVEALSAVILIACLSPRGRTLWVPRRVLLGGMDGRSGRSLSSGPVLDGAPSLTQGSVAQLGVACWGVKEGRGSHRSLLVRLAGGSLAAVAIAPVWTARSPMGGLAAWTDNVEDQRPTDASFQYFVIGQGRETELVALHSSTSALGVCQWLARPLRVALMQLECRWWSQWARRVWLGQLRNAALANYRVCMADRLGALMTWRMALTLDQAATFPEAVAGLPTVVLSPGRLPRHERWIAFRCCWRGCDKTFQSSVSLKNHVSRDHLHQFRWCRLCGMGVRLGVHMAQHQGGQRCLRRRSGIPLGRPP